MQRKKGGRPPPQKKWDGDRQPNTDQGTSPVFWLVTGPLPNMKCGHWSCKTAYYLVNYPGKLRLLQKASVTYNVNFYKAFFFTRFLFLTPFPVFPFHPSRVQKKNVFFFRFFSRVFFPALPLKRFLFFIYPFPVVKECRQ